MYKKYWEKSYLKNENSLYYPDENLIRFVNKHVTRRVGNKIKKNKIHFLDIGCGAGRNIVFLIENGFKVTGIDISKNAIFQAKKLLKFKKIPKNKYKLINSSSAEFNFENASFDVVFSCAALDSMPESEINNTINNIRQILKKKGLLYLDLMSTEEKHKGKFLNKYDQIKKGDFEKGTIQSYWDLNRIKKKFVQFKLLMLKKIITIKNNKIVNSRYLCVLQKI